jgi:hypothetical protein
MTPNHDLDSKLWAVLTEERLVDLSQFHRPGFFDEVPLFSRASEIDFLSRYSNKEVNAILIRFALKFLKAVVSYEEHRSSYFAAITVWPAPEGDPLVPNLFVWCGSVWKLRNTLVLEAARTSLAKGIRQIVSGKGSGGDGFEILEDRTTDPAQSRVFIALAKKPYENYVPASRLLKDRAPAR